MARNVLEGAVNTSQIPWLMDVTHDVLQGASNPDTRGRNFNNLMWASLGVIPGAGKALKNVRAIKSVARKVTGTATKEASTVAERQAAIKARWKYDPEKMAEFGPDVGPPVDVYYKDKDKWGPGKQHTQEEIALLKHRAEIQKDIDAGNYTPYYDESKRTDVDPADYPGYGRTLTEALPKRPSHRDKEIAEFTKRFDTPAIRARLRGAYKASVGDPGAHNFYAMKQLQDDFIKAYGETEGKARFKTQFADAMAATTGGADPTANYIMAQYGNWLNERGLPTPTESHQMPSPVGGQYATQNMAQFDKFVRNKEPMTASENPKRHNFSGDFVGYPWGTIDTRMSSLYEPAVPATPTTKKIPALQMPPGRSYGVMEKVLDSLAKKEGVPTKNFQDVAWAGGGPSGPMIRHVNHAIERTRRVTGKDVEDVVRDHIVKSKYRTFGIAGLLGALGLGASQGGDDTQQQ
jgi:hypothetical protein